MAGSRTELWLNEARRDILTRVQESITRFGMAGDLEIESDVIRLTGHGPDAVLDVRLLLEQWELLPGDERDRRCQDLARRLVAERRAHGASSLPPARRLGGLLSIAGTIAVLIALVFVGYMLLGPKGLLFAQRRADAESEAQRRFEREEEERATRAFRVCESTRERIARGASIGPEDVEGWVVELALLREQESAPPDVARELSGFLTPQTPAAGSEPALAFTWSGAPHVAALSGPSTRVATQPLTPAVPGYVGLNVTFGGRYVVPYFTEAERPEFVRAASAMAGAVRASHAALYARCAHGSARHLGSWFLAPGHAAAAATLVSFMAPSSSGTPAELFPELVKSAASLSRDRVLALIGREQGVLENYPSGQVALSFPFSDAHRASRAASVLGRTLSEAQKAAPAR